MAVIPFDITAFYAVFPAFQQIPVDSLQIYWDTATLFASDCLPPAPQVPRQTRYLQLLTAHLLAQGLAIQAGDPTAIVIGATIDKVTVTLQPPPEKSQFQWWLNQTPYGQQLLALLQVASVGGYYVGGFPNASAFRGR